MILSARLIGSEIAMKYGREGSVHSWACVIQVMACIMSGGTDLLIAGGTVFSSLVSLAFHG